MALDKRETRYIDFYAAKQMSYLRILTINSELIFQLRNIYLCNVFTVTSRVTSQSVF